MTEQPATEGPGTLATEAALLLDALADRLSGWDLAAHLAAHQAATPDAAALCTGCPICRFITALRSDRPEATALLVDGALGVVRALRSMLPDPDERPSRATASAGAADVTGVTGDPTANPGPAPSARVTGLQSIEIR